MTIAEKVKEEYDAQKRTGTDMDYTSEYNENLINSIVDKYNPECVINCDEIYECLGDREESYTIKESSTKNMAIYDDMSALIIIYPNYIGDILKVVPIVL